MSKFTKCPKCGAKVYKFATHCYNCNQDIKVAKSKKYKNIYSKYKLYIDVVAICLIIIGLIWIVFFTLEATEAILDFACEKINEFFVPMKYPSIQK